MPGKRRRGDPAQIRGLRFYDDAWEAYDAAAKREGMSRSEWIRAVLDAAVKRSERKAKRAAAERPEE